MHKSRLPWFVHPGGKCQKLRTASAHPSSRTAPKGSRTLLKENTIQTIEEQRDCIICTRYTVTRTHWYSIRVAECILNLFELDKSSMFQIVRKAQGFDILLKPRRYLTFISPEAIALELILQSSIHCLNFTEFFLCTGSRT